MKTLVIVESPAKAATIKKYLGNNYDVIASYGHICDLAKGGKNGIGIDIRNGFKPNYHILKDKRDMLQNIITQAEQSKEILLFSDEDMEGEAIAYHLQRYLSGTQKSIKRGIFSEITEKGIKQGLASLRDVDLKLVKAQEARRILDRIVGFMVSPYLINFFGPNLSAGRVQSVAVRMIVDREKEILTFKPEEYWNVSTLFEFESNKFITKYDGKLKSKVETDKLIQATKDASDFYVSKLQKTQKKEKPLPPLTTAKLQQYMAKKYGFDADKTMKSAQTLYEAGYTTYIRTDSVRISDEALKSTRAWLLENKIDTPKVPNTYATKSSAQDAHECIRPTNLKTAPNTPSLKGDDQKVYEAICNFFVASQMNPAIWNTVNVKVSSKSNKKLIFKASGKSLEYEGYLKIFGAVDPGKIDIPNFPENADVTLLPNSIKGEQKFTQPSPRFNKASILKELEDKGIGRPSTYAEIIKKISHRNYVELTGNTYKPTELGNKITNILMQSFNFMDYNYTASLEQQLDEIASGNLEQKNMLGDFFKLFKTKLDEAYTKNGSPSCKQCGGHLIKRTNSKDNSQFIACDNYPNCSFTQTIERQLE